MNPTAQRDNRFSSESVDPSATDPMFLSWGSSVNVCDELRRSIRSEIEEIDSSIATLQTDVKNEERSSAQVSKDLAHSRSEMLNLCRGAVDEKENAYMNHQIRIRMASTLKTEFLSIVVTPTSSPGSTSYENSSSDNEDEDDYSTDGKYVTGDASRKNKGKSLASQLTMFRSQFQEMSNRIADGKKEMQGLKAKIDDFEDEIKRTAQRVKDADLPSQLKEVERDVGSKRQELESEVQRRCSTKESIQRSMKRCGDFAQQIADKSKELSSEKANNESVIKELKINLKCREDEIKNLQSNELSAQEEKLRKITCRQKHLTQKRSEIDVIHSKMNAIVEEHKCLLMELQEIESKEKNQMKRLQSVEQSLEEVNEVMKKLKDIQDDLLEKKRQNDMKEETKVKAAESEKLQTFSKKEEVATHITQAHEKHAKEEAMNKESRDEISSFIAKQESDISAEKAILNEVQSLAKKSKEKLESELNFANAEIGTSNDLACKQEEASKVESERFDETFRLRTEELNSNFDYVKSERMFKTQQERFKLEVLKRSAILLEKTQMKENEMQLEVQKRMEMVHQSKKVTHQNETELNDLFPSTVIIEPTNVEGYNDFENETEQFDYYQDSKPMEHSKEVHDEGHNVDASEPVIENLTQGSQSSRSSRKTKASLSQNSGKKPKTSSSESMEHSEEINDENHDEDASDPVTENLTECSQSSKSSRRTRTSLSQNSGTQSKTPSRPSRRSNRKRN